MWGAIIGDIVGSVYEFYNIKTKDFPLFSEGSRFTDDTVLTVAVAEGLMDGFGDEEKTEKCVLQSIVKFVYKYPYSSYGQRFMRWILTSADHKPYNSFGNGSAMRVSPAGWLFDDLETTERYAGITARVSHNHPEGIKGAASVAGAIFLARTGKNKTEIKTYIEEKYGYNLGRRLDEIRPDYRHIETCQDSVPEAITAFLEGESYEDTIRNAVSIGGDSDTIAAIAGSIAQGMWEIPEHMIQSAAERLDGGLKSVIERWDLFLNEKRR